MISVCVRRDPNVRDIELAISHTDNDAVAGGRSNGAARSRIFNIRD